MHRTFYRALLHASVIICFLVMKRVIAYQCSCGGYKLETEPAPKMEVQELQIWNGDFSRKWMSRCARAGQQISTIRTCKRHKWVVTAAERNQEENGVREQLTWNIYTIRNGVRLYATYDLSGDGLTLQERISRQAAFILNVAPNGMILIKTSELRRNRFVRQVGNLVKVEEVASFMELDRSFEWEFAHPDLSGKFLKERTVKTYTVIVQKSSSMNEVWSHFDVTNDDSIPVTPRSSKFALCWNMIKTSTDDNTTFTKHCPNSKVPKSIVGWDKGGIELLPLNTIDDKAFGFVPLYTNTGVILQKGSQDEYVGISNNVLHWKERRNAEQWSFPIAPDEDFISLEDIEEIKRKQMKKEL